ncbi:hypothetical protein Tco_0401087 [Tanacetum coccineum]
MSSDKESSAARTDNHLPMLVESDYDSWKIRIHRPGVNMPRMKLEFKVFTPEETNRKNADTQAEIILSQGLPRHIFNILNQTNTAKEIWDNVEMLMQGSGRTLQQRKEDLFDETHKPTVHDGPTVTETVQEKTIGNVGNTGEGHVQGSANNQKRAKESFSTTKTKMLLMEAKEKGVTLDAEVEAFLANMECTAPYDQPLAMAITNIFEVNHEDAYDSDVDEGPNAAALDDNTTPYHQLELERKAKVVPTEVSTGSSANISMVTILDEMRDTLDEKLRKSMNLRHDRLQYGFYEKLNAMMFVPQKELSREQVYWLLANEIASQASTPATPVTPYMPKSPPPIKPLYVSLPCYEYAKEFALQQVVPFLDYFKKHVQTADDTIVKEVAEFKEIHYALEDEYERCRTKNNDSLLYVLLSDIVVPPSSNCLCEELRSNCDREHSKVVELEAEILKKQQMLNESEKRCAFIEKNHVNLQVKFQKYKECLQNQMVCDNTNSTASNIIFEINKLNDQLQGKDDTIRNLQTQINITRMLNVGSTVGSFDKQALETELTQLKDALTLVRIQIDGYKAENVNLKRRYEDLLKSNAYSRSTFTAKINALTAENAKLKTELSGKKSSGSTASEKPKVLASGMYTNSSKYVPPPKRANWVKPTSLPKKKQVTFQEPLRTSNGSTQKPPVQQNKKPNVSVNLSTRTKPATESRKPMPKSHTQNHRILPSKSVNARRAADHNRKLNVVDHNQFVIRSLKSVNTKTPQAKHSVNHTKKVWKATRNHNVNTTKTACVTTERFCWYVEASVETH